MMEFEIGDEVWIKEEDIELTKNLFSSLSTNNIDSDALVKGKIINKINSEGITRYELDIAGDGWSFTSDCFIPLSNKQCFFHEKI